MDLTTKFDLDITPFINSLKKAAAEAQNLLKIKPTVDTAAVSDLSNQLNAVDTNVNVGVQVDSGGLDAIQQQISGLDANAFVNVVADVSSIDNVAEKINDISDDTKVNVDVNADSSDVRKADADVEELSKDIKEIPDNKKVNIDVNSDKATTVINNISGGFGKLGSFISGAVGGALAGVATNAISNFGQAADKADELGDRLEVAFSQAGVQDVNAELEKVDTFAASISDQFAISSDKTKELFGSVVALSGQTGQAAEDTTKLALGIEAASGGLVSAEQAAKLLSKGISDPESAAQLDALVKKFPELRDSLTSTAPLADKAKLGLDALGNTFGTLEKQAQGPDAALAKIQDRLNVAAQGIGTAFLEGLAPALNQIVPLIGTLASALQPVLEQLGGQLAGALGNLATQVLPILIDALTPIINTLGTVLPPIIDLVVSALANLLPVIQQIFTQLGPVIGQLIGALAPVLGDIIAVVSQLAGRIIQALLPVITKILGTITKLLPVLSPIIDALGDALGPIIDTLAQLFSALIEPLLPLIDVLVKAFAPILEIVVRVLGILINVALKPLIPLINLLTLPLKILSGIFDGVGKFANFVSGVFKKLINDNPVLKKTFEAVQGAIQKLLGFLPDFIKEALGLKNANNDVKKSSKEVGDAQAQQGKTTEDNTKKTKDNTDNKDKNAKASGKQKDALLELINAEKASLEAQSKTIELTKKRELDALEERKRAAGRLSDSEQDRIDRQEIELKAQTALTKATGETGKALDALANSGRKQSDESKKALQDFRGTVLDSQQAFRQIQNQQLDFRINLNFENITKSIETVKAANAEAAKNFGDAFKDQDKILAAVVKGTQSNLIASGQAAIDELQNGLNTLTAERDRLQAILQVQADPKALEDTRKQLTSVADELSKKKIQLEYQPFNEELKKDVAALEADKKRLEEDEVNIVFASDPKNIEKIKEQLKGLDSEIENSNNQAKEFRNTLENPLQLFGGAQELAIDLKLDARGLELTEVERNIEKEFEKRNLAIERTFQQELQTREKQYDEGLLNDQQYANAVASINQRRNNALKKSGDERIKLLQDEAKKTNAIGELFKSIGDNIANALFPDLAEINKRKAQLEEGLKGSAELLEVQLDLQLISYEDYNASILDIDKKRQDEQKKLEEEAMKARMESINKIGQDALPGLNKAFEESSANLTTTLQKDGATFGEVANAGLEALTAVAAQGLALALANADSLEQIGKEFIKATLEGILNLIKGQLQAFIFSAIGIEASTKGTLALITAPLITAALNGLFALAKNSILSAIGYEKGGYTGDKGTKEVAGVVHGQEYVLNAKATKGNRKVLEWLNKTGGTFEEYARKNSSQFATTDLTPFKHFDKRIFNVEKAIENLTFDYNADGIIKGVVEKMDNRSWVAQETLNQKNTYQTMNVVDTASLNASVNGLAHTMDARLSSMETTLAKTIKDNATITRSQQFLDVNVAADPGSTLRWARKIGKINGTR